MAINFNHKANAIMPSCAKEPSNASAPQQRASGATQDRKQPHDTTDILSVSASFQAKIKSLDQLKSQPPKENNSTIDGELKRMGDMLARMKVLSVQAKSIPLNPGQQEQLNSEFDQLKKEIQRFSNATAQKGFSIPYDPNQSHVDQIDSRSTPKNLENNWIQSVKIQDENSVDSAISVLDSTITNASKRNTSLNGIQDRITAAFTAIASLDPRPSNLKSSISDSEKAIEVARTVASSIKGSPQSAYFAQSNQNTTTSIHLLK